jgi:hypothetical protein
MLAAVEALTDLDQDMPMQMVRVLLRLTVLNEGDKELG